MPENPNDLLATLTGTQSDSTNDAGGDPVAAGGAKPISAEVEERTASRAKEAFEVLSGGPLEGGDDDQKPDDDETKGVEEEETAVEELPGDGDDLDDTVYQPVYAAGMTRGDLAALKPAARARLLISLSKGGDVDSKKAEAPVSTGPKPEDFTELFAEDFDEETAKKLGPKFHKLLSPLFEKQGKLEEERVRSQAETEKRAFIAAANSAFVSMPEAEKVYGKGDWSTLDRKHKEARGIAFDVADLVMAGARAKGRNLTPDEALRVGHAYVSLTQLKQLAVVDVTAKLQQRTSGRSIAPSHARAGKPRALTGREAFKAEVAKLVGEA